MIPNGSFAFRHVLLRSNSSRIKMCYGGGSVIVEGGRGCSDLIFGEGQNDVVM